MGVFTLTTFMRNNPHLLCDYKLRNRKLIIDGNNLYNIMFYDSNIDYQHGGDYLQYSMYVADFFNKLKLCGLEPYVVFDGGHDTDDIKLQRRMEKSRERIVDIRSNIHGPREKQKKIIPLLTYEAYRQTIAALKIPFVVCDFEADHEAAVLANDLDCPVLSFDSDFYIFPIKAGYIPFHSLDLNSIEQDQMGHFLKCKIYTTHALTSYFPRLGNGALLLLATLLGNDFVTKVLFSNFFEDCKRRIRFNTQGLICKPFFPIGLILSWMKTLDDFNQGIEEVLAKVSDETKVRTSIGLYSLDPARCSLRLSDFFRGIVQDRMAKSFSGIPLPNWITRAHTEAIVSMVFQNIIVMRRNMFRSQMEDLHSPSSYICARDARKVLYGILTSLDRSDENPKPIAVTEVDRQAESITSEAVSSSVDVPALTDIPSMCSSRRQGFLMSTLDVAPDVIEHINDDMRLPLAVMRYCLQNSCPNMNVNHVRAMVLCVLALHMFIVQTGLQLSGIPSVMQTLRKLPKEEIETITPSLTAGLGTVEEDKRPGRQCSLDITITHAFAQYQASFMAAIDLNQVLLNPYRSLNPSEIIHGRYLYQLYKEFKEYRNPDHVIGSRLKGSSVLQGMFQNWFYAVTTDSKYLSAV